MKLSKRDVENLADQLLPLLIEKLKGGGHLDANKRLTAEMQAWLGMKLRATTEEVSNHFECGMKIADSLLQRGKLKGKFAFNSKIRMWTLGDGVPVTKQSKQQSTGLVIQIPDGFNPDSEEVF